MNDFVDVKILRENDDIKIPTRMSDGAAGYDVYSPETVCIFSHTKEIINLKFKIVIPKGYEIQVRTRSGLAAKHGVFVLNSPGTIDSDYRGDCMVILQNNSDIDYLIKKGERIAQFVLKKCTDIEFNDITNEEFKNYITERNDGRFSSTGK